MSQRRRWLFSACWSSTLVPVEVGLGLLGSLAGWVLCVSLPLAVFSWVGWWKTRPPRPRPDYALIAELERTELGIDPRSERRPDCRHEHPHEVVLMNGHRDRICLDCGIGLALKPVPPSGPGAGSPTVR